MLLSPQRLMQIALWLAILNGAGVLFCMVLLLVCG